MVQVIDDPYRKGTAFGRLGKGIGQGLSDQIPKEVDRYRLSSGLQQLGKDAPNLSPFEQLTRFYSIPGVTPSMVESGTALLREEATRANAKRRGEKANAAIQQNTNTASPQFDNTVNQQEIDPQKTIASNAAKHAIRTNEAGIAKPRPQQASVGLIRPFTQEEYDKELADFFTEFPNESIEKGMAYVNDKEKRKVAEQEALVKQGQRQEAIEDSFRDLFDKELMKRTGKKTIEETYSLVSPESRKLLQDQGDIKYAKSLASNNPKTKRQIVDEQVQEAKQLQNSWDSIRELKNKGIFDISWKNQNKIIERAAEPFRKIGNQEEYRNLLTNELDYPQQYASYFAFQIKDNKELNNYIAKQPRVQFHARERRPGFSAEERMPVIMSDIKKMIKGDDSLQSIALALAQKGIPYERTIQDFRNDDAFYKNLNTRQQRELNYDANRFSLKGMWMQTMGGLPPIQEIE